MYAKFSWFPCSLEWSKILLHWRRRLSNSGWNFNFSFQSDFDIHLQIFNVHARSDVFRIRSVNWNHQRLRKILARKVYLLLLRWRHPDHGQPVHTKLCKNRRRQNGVQCTDYIQVIFLITSRFLSLTKTFQAKMVRWPFDLFTQVGQGWHERYALPCPHLNDMSSQLN